MVNGNTLSAHSARAPKAGNPGSRGFLLGSDLCYDWNMIKPVLDRKDLQSAEADTLLQQTHHELIHVVDGDLSEEEFDDLTLEKVCCESVVFNQVTIDDLTVLDSSFSKCSFAGAVIEHSHFTRTELVSTRLQGIQLTELSATDTAFITSKLNDANFRYAKLKNVLFRQCDLTAADFIGATLENVVFEDCELNGVNFSQATLKNIDLSGSRITDVVISPEAIKEVFVDTGQAIYLSSLFGLKIKD